MNFEDDNAERRRGRPPTYVWNGDEKLSPSMEKLKLSIERRRQRQKASYHKKKELLKNKNYKRQMQKQKGFKQDSPRRTSTSKDLPVANGAAILDFALAGNGHASSESRRTK